jgi:nucleotide-binding universal stress UspA family protein
MREHAPDQYPHVAIPRLPLRRILHPCDLSPASEVAFVHALKLALIAKAELSMLHIGPDISRMHWTDFPGVRETLARWQYIPPGSSRDEVLKLGLEVEKIVTTSPHPVDTIVQSLQKNPADLLVLAAHQREGRGQWLNIANALAIARRSETMTLFIPHGKDGFISRRDGTSRLQRVLIPVAKTPDPQAAIEAAAVLAVTLGHDSMSFMLIHIGVVGDMPLIHEPMQPGWHWERTIRHGEVAEQIAAVETLYTPNLIILTTQVRHSFLQSFRSRTSEQILRAARCPVLAIPASV